MTATLILPCWNRLIYTQACLESLTPALRPGWDVVLIDNGSSDGTRSVLRRWAARAPVPCRVVANRRNLGYAAAMNQGASLAAGKLLLFLNNDVLLGEETLERLAGGWKRLPRAGGLSPSLGDWRLPRAEFERGPSRAVDRLRAFAWTVSRFFGDEVRPTDYFINGACFLTGRAAFEEVGGFDERFFLGGYEDIDLQLRLTNAGRSLGWAMGAYIHHFKSTSFGGNGIERASNDAVNRLHLVRRWDGRAARLPRMRGYLKRLAGVR